MTQRFVYNIILKLQLSLALLWVHHDFCPEYLEKFKKNVMLVLAKPLQRFEID